MECMQTVILAAGRGTRFGTLTETTNKCLLRVAGKPIIERVMDALPDDESEIIIVVKHFGEHIRKQIGTRYKRHPVKYADMGKRRGTAGALWSARPFLHDTFMVLNGDDIPTKASIARLMRSVPAFGFTRHRAPGFRYCDVVLDKDRYVKKLAPLPPGNALPFVNLAAGAYTLDHAIFRERPVKLKNGEYGLPQTIMKLAARCPVRGVPMPGTLFINTPEELARAERRLRYNKKHV